MYEYRGHTRANVSVRGVLIKKGTSVTTSPLVQPREMKFCRQGPDVPQWEGTCIGAEVGLPSWHRSTTQDGWIPRRVFEYKRGLVTCLISASNLIPPRYGSSMIPSNHPPSKQRQRDAAFSSMEDTREKEKNGGRGRERDTHTQRERQRGRRAAGESEETTDHQRSFPREPEMKCSKGENLRLCILLGELI